MRARDEFGELLLGAGFVDEADAFWPDLVENDASDSRLNDALLGVAIDALLALVGVLEVDAVVHLHLVLGHGEFDFAVVGKQREALAFALRITRLL